MQQAMTQSKWMQLPIIVNIWWLKEEVMLCLWTPKILLTATLKYFKANLNLSYSAISQATKHAVNKALP